MAEAEIGLLDKVQYRTIAAIHLSLLKILSEPEFEGCENCYRTDSMKRIALQSECQNGRPLVENQRVSDTEIVSRRRTEVTQPLVSRDPIGIRRRDVRSDDAGRRLSV